MKRRTLIASGSAVGVSMMLSACGSGSSSSGSSQIRFINANVGYNSLAFAVDTSATTAPVAYGSVSGYGSYNSGTVTMVTSDGSSGTLVTSTSRLINKGVNYTFVAYGSSRAVKLMQLSDDEVAAATGYTKLRVLNLAADSGALAVYLTTETADLASSTPTFATVGGDSASGYISVPSASYRVRVTAAGDPTDVRFDASGISLSSTGVVALALTPGPSGVLVQGILVVQGSTVTPLPNRQSRVRVVASVADNAVVNASVGSTLLLDNVRSPAIGIYATVTAGSLPLSITVNGKAVATPDLAAVAGTDYTLLVTGPSSAPSVVVLTEDNRLPLVASNCRVRLVHAASGLSASGLTLTVNYAALAQDVKFGTSSAYTEVAAGTNMLIDVANPLAVASAANFSGVTLLSGGLYTVFVVMGTNGPAGILRKER